MQNNTHTDSTQDSPSTATHLIKECQVVENTWLVMENNDANALAVNTVEAQTIVPLSLWQSSAALASRNDIGIWLADDTDLTTISPESIRALPVIAIHFPAFANGRGFSLARLLRERLQYTGEIRAIGHIIRDQLCYLKRCGFNAFFFEDASVNLNAALDSLNDFTESYQTSADQPIPLFRRR